MVVTPTLAETILNHLLAFAYLSFVWVPVMFLAFAIGRRRLTTRFFLVFVSAEAVAIALALYLPGWIGL
jgi:hypothetical protein